jgi:hypothetical protein
MVPRTNKKERTMDVFCVGMYRACSTWQYEVIAHLLERHRRGQRLGYLTGEEYAALGRAWRPGRSWRVLKSHEGNARFADALASGEARAVYAHRDIRDVVFSLMHKRGVSFDDLLRRGMIHQLLVNDRFWKARPGLLVQRYEDLIANPVQGVEELAAHLGIALAKGEAENVAQEYSFQANRERAQRLCARLRAAGVDLDRSINSQVYDGQTLLHWNHLRGGGAGGWRSEATERERAILNRLGGGWLRAHGYEVEATPALSLRDRAVTARGRLTCTLRCLALRFPRMARIHNPSETRGGAAPHFWNRAERSVVTGIFSE